jgi:hypothetical protein
MARSAFSCPRATLINCEVSATVLGFNIPLFAIWCYSLLPVNAPKLKMNGFLFLSSGKK